MERLAFANKKNIVIFSAFFIAGVITCMMPIHGWRPHHITAFCYISMIIIWALIIRRRILNEKVRHRILIACIFMVLLFFFRMCKFSFFPDIYILEETLWYLYYIPMTAIPMVFFMAAQWVDPVKNARALILFEKIAIAVWVIVCIVASTNHWHNFVFKITVPPYKEYTHNWFYFIIFAWMLIFGLGSFYTLFLKCSLSAAKKLWFIPAICIAAGCVLLAWYLIVGGSPRIAGYKIFQIHEAYCFPFIAGFESMILIGMIPANTGYERLFDRSMINACIFDAGDNPVLPAEDWTKQEGDADHPLRTEEVSGGYVSWIEDLSAITSLNAQIAEVTEELEGENDLIRQENDIRAERVSYETKNRLYNRIAAAVRTRAVDVNELLKYEYENEDEFHDCLKYALVQTAYIKRMGNLMIVTDGVKSLSTGELKLAINESLDYIRLKDCACDLIADGECEVSSALMLLAYELFECAVEDVWSRLNSLAVVFETGDKFAMTIALDRKAEAISPSWKDKEISKAGGRLSVTYVDETYYIRLEADA